MNWTVIFAVLTVLGPILIATSAKKQAGDKDQPMGVQAGYLALVLGGFGLLAQWLSFSAVMLVFVLVTGVITAANRWLLAPRRDGGALEPHYVEYAKSFFPIMLAVFMLRAFLVEPFQIPSSSMRPGLVVGDFILVNKFAYGVRTPIINNVLIPVGQVQRGDVVVFNFPPDPKVNFIKRVIGLPGDTVSYRDKQLSINGKALPLQEDGAYSYVETGKGASMVQTRRLKEHTPDGREYHVLHEDGKPSVFTPAVADFPGREHCQYDERGFTCKVPAGQYLMLGDNRDNSHDGRYWGFVEDKLLVGKAFMVWMNLGEFGRIGHRIQ